MLPGIRQGCWCPYDRMRRQDEQLLHTCQEWPGSRGLDGVKMRAVEEAQDQALARAAGGCIVMSYRAAQTLGIISSRATGQRTSAMHDMVAPCHALGGCAGQQWQTLQGTREDRGLAAAQQARSV